MDERIDEAKPRLLHTAGGKSFWTLIRTQKSRIGSKEKNLCVCFLEGVAAFLSLSPTAEAFFFFLLVLDVTQ